MILAPLTSLVLGVLALEVAATQPVAPPARPLTRNVAIVLYEGVELLDFAGPGEVFAAAANAGASRDQPAFKVYTVAATRAPLVSLGFVTVTPEFSIDDAPRPDLIVIPGGNSSKLTDDPRFMAWLKKAAETTEVAMSVCSGAFALGKAGLLDGKQATTWYGSVARLRKATPKANVQEGRRFIDEGKVITTAGVSAGIDGALHVVARLLGRSVADETARYMEYHWTPEPYLATAYPLLNPSLDDRGRATQRAELLESEKSWADAAKGYRTLIDQDANDGYAWNRLAVVLAASGSNIEAITAGKRAAAFPDQKKEALVTLACLHAKTGKKDEALKELEEAVSAGYAAKWRLKDDDDLAAVRSDPRFVKLLARL